MDQAIQPTPDGDGQGIPGAIRHRDNGSRAVFGGGHYDDTYEKTAEGASLAMVHRVVGGPNPTIKSARCRRRNKIATVASKPGTLTTSDYIEIQQLVSHHPFGLTPAPVRDLWAASSPRTDRSAAAPPKSRGRKS
jgi:hypothetical protein